MKALFLYCAGMKESKRNIAVGFFFLLLTQVLYWPARNAGLVTDFVGTVERLRPATLLDVLQNTFGFYGFQQINFLFLFTYFKIFGVEFPLGWHLVYTFTHSLNALLLFLLFKRLLGYQQIRWSAGLAFSIALLWLTAPYHTEAVVWEVCYSYLITTTMIIGILMLLHRWYQSANAVNLWFAHGLFLVALFTFENSFIVPGITLLLMLFFWEHKRVFQRTFLLALLGTQIGLLFFRLLLSKLVFNSWAAHYGDDVHLNFNIIDWLGSSYKYAGKYLLYTRYQSGQFENGIMDFFSQVSSVLWLTGGLLLLLVWLSFYFYKVNPKLKVIAFFVIAFGMAILPVHNLFMVTLMYVEGDRLGYLASIFFYGWLVVLISFLPRLIYLPLLFICFLFNIYYLNLTTTFWQGSAQVSQALLTDFRWPKEKEIVLLNVPDNFRGAPMFRNITGSQLAFADAYRYILDKPIEGKVYEVAQYNMSTINDGVRVELDSTDRIKVTFNQYGNWWWRLKIGATDYETDRYRFQNRGQFYLLDFKQPIENSTLIYQDGLKWKTFTPKASSISD